MQVSAILHRVGHFASGRSAKQQTNNKQTKLTPSDSAPEVVNPYPCHRIEPVIGVNLRLVDRDAFPAFGKIFLAEKNSSAGRFLFFSPAKNRPVVRRYPCQALNGWTVCRFHGARGGDAERQEEWQLPARRQDEGNDRGLEAHNGPGDRASSAGIVPMSAFDSKRTSRSVDGGAYL